MSRSRDTPGRKLIEDLLAKNVAKYAAEDEINNKNKEISDGKKRKTSSDDFKKKKKKKNRPVEQKDEYGPDLNFSSRKDDFKFALKNEKKVENLEYTDVKVEGYEYTEIEVETKYLLQHTKPKPIELDKEVDDTESVQVKIKVEDAKNDFQDVANEIKCKLKRNKKKRKNPMILNLLAKSVAKIKAGEAEHEIGDRNKETFGEKQNGEKRRKPIHKGKSSKNHDSSAKTDHVKCELKTEDFKLVEVKSDGKEYTEIKTENIEINKENIEVKNNFLDMKPIPIKLKPEIDGFDVADTKTVPVEPKTKDIMKMRLITQRKSGIIMTRISPEEDKILLEEMEKFGDNINISQLAKNMKRDARCVRIRVNRLKTGNLSRERHTFVLAEDLVIMDTVLTQLPERSLNMLELPFTDWNIVGAQLGRIGSSLRTRWEFCLKPWLLQHFSGTLNLDIRRMLANYLAEHFEDIDSVDWFAVARKPKFVGHTLISLRNIFFKNLFKFTKKSKGGNSEVTLKDVADCTNAKYKSVGLCTVQKNILTRQKEIIDYFEQYVKKQGIEMFDVYSK
eukprot:GFUD01024004.1.p1 GENE.GFUD01024004.1~~GFUD01024004.1.p1  ORF type:complete len:561 (+),score=154.47 GFUD01024004.1:132-1814(+)